MNYSSSRREVNDGTREKSAMSLPAFLLPLHKLDSMAGSGSPTGGGPLAQGSLPNFIMQTQAQTKWCWAAVSSSVAVFFGSNAWSQCKIACAEFPPHACCGQDAATGNCNQAWHLDAALKRVGHLKQMDSMHLAFVDLQGEIGAGNPLGCYVAWAGGGGHFLALAGWRTMPNGKQMVDVYDPYYGFTQIDYTDLCSAYRGAGNAWTHSYRTVSATGPLGGAAAPAAASPKNA
jgi:hypothetical protein